jgi:hypothetical protein
MTYQEVWIQVYEALREKLNRPPSPDEIQDALEDYAGQTAGT